MSVAELSLVELAAAIERDERNETLADEAERLKSSLREFVRAAWGIVWPNTRYVDGWHIDTVCDHLEAVSAGEIRRLQIWIPPGTMKSTTVSILWPAWEWATRPELRYITASYDLDLATDFAVKSRDLIRSHWYRQRFPHVELKRDQDLKRSYANTQGGVRHATSPSGGGTGRHGDRIIIDDPLNAREVASDAKLEEAIDWHDGTLSTRFADPETSAEVLIMQRLHERDLAGHVLGQADWTILCLPERYEARHPFVTPASRVLDSGRVLDGDRRQAEGELLWPARVGENGNAARQLALGAHRSAGQLQQRPAAREGAILKRGNWRYFPPTWLEDDQLDHLPVFTAIVQSWDTAFKDRTHNDYVAGGIWGQRGPDLYLLRLERAHLSLSATKARMREASAWAAERWPKLPHWILIEKSANGIEIIAELRRELRGVTAVTASTSKVARAEAAEPALEAGNVWVPGERDEESAAGYDAARTPAFTQALIEEAASFPLGEHDDQVDMLTQVVNWTRLRGVARAKIARPSASAAVVPTPGSMAG